MEKEEKSIKELIEHVQRCVYSNNYHISVEQLITFSKYFEDMIFNNLICEGNVVRVYKTDKQISGNLSSSLIAAGIKREESEIQEKYPYLYLYSNRDNLLYAKEKIKGIE